MTDTTVWDVFAGLGGLATGLGVLTALWVGVKTMREHRDVEGTDTCRGYRSQVIELHDRGVPAARIRALLALEDPENAYQKEGPSDPDTGRLKIERLCGCIDDITALSAPQPGEHPGGARRRPPDDTEATSSRPPRTAAS